MQKKLTILTGVICIFNPIGLKRFPNSDCKLNHISYWVGQDLLPKHRGVYSIYVASLVSAVGQVLTFNIESRKE